MLTGEHKIGDYRAEIEFADHGNTLIEDAKQRFAIFDSSELRHLRDLLNAHFGEWTPCGPDGPFPENGEMVFVTILILEQNRRLLGVDWITPQGKWSFWDGGTHAIIAWKPYLKPYNPGSMG